MAMTLEPGGLRLTAESRTDYISNKAVHTNILIFFNAAVHAYMEKGKSHDCKDCGENYVLIKDEDDPKLAMFEKPLPCCGCGIGWSFLLLGFLCPLVWYCAATLYLCKYYNKDPRERSGLAACAIAAFVCTIVTLIILAVIFL